MDYEVTFEQLTQYTLEVQADNAAEAVEKAEAMSERHKVRTPQGQSYFVRALNLDTGTVEMGRP